MLHYCHVKIKATWHHQIQGVLVVLILFPIRMVAYFQHAQPPQNNTIQSLNLPHIMAVETITWPTVSQSVTAIPEYLLAVCISFHLDLSQQCSLAPCL